MAKEVAIKKRALIDQASKNMFIAVAIASVILGFTIVGVIYLTKWIAFNAKVIGEKSQIISDYNSSIKNLPLLNNAILSLANNSDLESVARTRESACESLQSETLTDVETAHICSALRVIPDALPATHNPEALLASLNKIFLVSGTSPENISPADSGEESPILGIDVIPVTLSVSGDGTLTKTVLSNIEKSIRTFEMGVVTIEWRGVNTVLLRGQANAFYSSEKKMQLLTKTICADDKSAKCSSSTGGQITQ